MIPNSTGHTNMLNMIRFKHFERFTSLNTALVTSHNMQIGNHFSIQGISDGSVMLHPPEHSPGNIQYYTVSHAIPCIEIRIKMTLLS